jgi:hypothetical protein
MLITVFQLQMEPLLLAFPSGHYIITFFPRMFRNIVVQFCNKTTIIYNP